MIENAVNKANLAIKQAEKHLTAAFEALEGAKGTLPHLKEPIRHRFTALAEIVDTARNAASNLATDNSQWGDYRSN